MNNIFESLIEMTGRAKGLVEFADGTVVICDWSPLDGSPRLAVGSMSGSTDPVEVESEIRVKCWKTFAEDASSLINCLGIDVESEEDCGARIFNLTDDISIIVPDNWEENKKTIPVAETEKKDGMFCTCKDTACRFHPVNHDRGCTPCIENNLGKGEIPGCFINKAGLPGKTEGYSIKDFAETLMFLNKSTVEI